MRNGTYFRMLILVALIVALMASIQGCAQLGTAALVLQGARDGNGNISQTGKRCERDCGQATTWKDGKKVVIDE